MLQASQGCAFSSSEIKFFSEQEPFPSSGLSPPGKSKLHQKGIIMWWSPMEKTIPRAVDYDPNEHPIPFREGGLAYNALVALLYLLITQSPLWASPQDLELTVDTSQSVGQIDLTRYSLGQGGLSHKPMFDGMVDQVAQLHPQTVRVFIADYYRIYPEHGRYYWDALDKTIETILATGAKPIMCLVLKPRPLFPKIDQTIVHPADYAEWEELIFQLVKHCNQERKFGIQYWEVGNEVDIGEDGGSPYLFKPDDYTIYYSHTVSAVLRADPNAKVGGPALADYRSNIGDALLQYCGSGKAPLHFLSWHMYDSDPQKFRHSIEVMKAKLGRYPSLKGVETVLDEWNMSLSVPLMDPYFQPAFILENTYGFYEEGLTRSGYYHIRDYFVDPEDFRIFLSEPGAAFVEYWWNVMPQYDGLYDNQSRVRPAYYSFKLLSLIQGEQLRLKGANSEVKGFAARQGRWTAVVFWRYPSSEKEATVPVTVRFPFEKSGKFQVARLNPERAVNNLEVVRHEDLSKLDKDPIRTNLHPYEVYWIEIEH